MQRLLTASLLLLSSHSFAQVPPPFLELDCPNGETSRLIPTQGIVEVDAVVVGPDAFDVQLQALPSGQLQVISAIDVAPPSTPDNFFVAESNSVRLGCAAVGKDTFVVDLSVDSLEQGLLGVSDFRPVGPTPTASDILIDYQNSEFDDSVISLNPDGSLLLDNQFSGNPTLLPADLSPPPGTVGARLLFGGGATFFDIFMNLLNLVIAGSYDHFSEQGDFTGGLLGSPGDDALLGDGDRFQVEIDFFNDPPADVDTHFVQQTPNAGYFYFFSPDNQETVLRVMNGCGYNDRYWIFAASSSDVPHQVTVTDTVSGESKIFENDPLQDGFEVSDTDAFATCP